MYFRKQFETMRNNYVQQSQNGFDISFKRKIKLNDDKTCVIFA